MYIKHSNEHERCCWKMKIKTYKTALNKGDSFIDVKAAPVIQHVAYAGGTVNKAHVVFRAICCRTETKQNIEATSIHVACQEHHQYQRTKTHYLHTYTSVKDWKMRRTRIFIRTLDSSKTKLT